MEELEEIRRRLRADPKDLASRRRVKQLAKRWGLTPRSESQSLFVWIFLHPEITREVMKNVH